MIAQEISSNQYLDTARELHQLLFGTLFAGTPSARQMMKSMNGPRLVVKIGKALMELGGN
jgi:hypothetical protein